MKNKAGKDKILDAALELFSNQGFHRTSVDQIAKAAGVSKGLTYNYFNSKEDLLLAIVERATACMMDVASHMQTSSGYQLSLHDFLVRYGRSLETGKRYLSFQLSLFFQPDLKVIVAPLLQKRAEELLCKTEAMFESAGAKDPIVVARRFVSELDGVALHYLAVFEDFPLEMMLVQLYENYKDTGK